MTFYMKLQTFFYALHQKIPIPPNARPDTGIVAAARSTYSIRRSPYEPRNRQMDVDRECIFVVSRPSWYRQHAIILACNFRRDTLFGRIYSRRTLPALSYTYDIHHVHGILRHTCRRPFCHKRACVHLPCRFCADVPLWAREVLH